MPTSATPITHLFVYGTLLSVSKHQMARYLRQHSQLVGPGFFPGWLYDLGSYPGAVYDPTTDGSVHGEIYSFPESDVKNQLLTLDEYEGDEYVRMVVPVQTEGGFINCWTYIFNQPTDSLSVIASGRYFG